MTTIPEILFQATGLTSILLLLLSSLFFLKSYLYFTGIKPKDLTRIQKPNAGELFRKMKIGEITEIKVKKYFTWYKTTQRFAFLLFLLTILLMLINGVLTR